MPRWGLPEPLGEDSLGLLDQDAAIQRDFQLQIIGGLTREYCIAALPPSVATEMRPPPHRTIFPSPAG
jgi:hypothetical protein